MNLHKPHEPIFDSYSLTVYTILGIRKLFVLGGKIWNHYRSIGF